MSLASEAVGGAGIQIDGPAFTTQKIPGDGSERDPAFARVRQALLSAARRNDLDAVVRHFAPQTRCYTAVGLINEEGMMTAEACAAQLRADSDEARAFFQACNVRSSSARRSIRGDCRSLRGSCGGYRPVATGNTWFYFVVAADRVRARSAPSSRAPVVELLSYDIVTTVTANADAVAGTEVDACDAWQQIVTPSKREAWICAKYLAAPLDGTRFFPAPARRRVAIEGRLRN